MSNITNIIIFITTFALATLCGPMFIPLLKRLKFGQTVRDNGPQTHLKKMGTPTVGGLIFLTPLLLVSVYLNLTGKAVQILPLAFVTAGFGFIGFLDDFIKIVRKRKDGLLWYQKMIALLIVSIAFAYYMSIQGGTVIELSFFGYNSELDLAWFFIPFTVLVLLSSTNAVNLTDGLDGLAGGASFIVFMFYTIVAIMIKQNISVSLFAVAAAGACLGFLVFNVHPAKVIMGDTGSLALGGAIGACAIMLKNPLILFIAGLLFVIEALSVLLQISYFKITHGKRLFRMAPIHHHFELKGWKETKVVGVFWLVTLISCIVAYICLAIGGKS